MKIQPVIKWTGSKRKQSEEIISHFPKQIKTYYEPFVGGGSVMFQLLHSDIEVEKYVCSDINKDLIDLWNVIKDNPEKIITKYKEMWDELNKDEDLERKKQYYNEVRKRYNTHHQPEDFLFISRTCINGLIRYNRNGKFNSSFHITRKGIDPKTLEKIVNQWSSKLKEKNVQFIHRDYNTIKAVEGDYLYLDPPYAGTKGMYNGGIDLEGFYEWLKQQGCRYALSFDGSSGDTEFTQKVPTELYTEHKFLSNGNSTFKKTKVNKNEYVQESLYLK